MIDYNTWFWSPYAHFLTTSEGPGNRNTPYGASDNLDPAQTIPNFVFGNRKHHITSFWGLTALGMGRRWELHECRRSDGCHARW